MGMEEQSVVMDEQGVILVEPVQEEEANALNADELAEEIELDNHQEPTQFRLEVMLPIILAAAIILIAVCVMLLYHFVWKKRPHPTYKLIDATDVTTDLLVEEIDVSTYETFDFYYGFYLHRVQFIFILSTFPFHCICITVCV